MICALDNSSSDLARNCGEDLEPSEFETVLGMQIGNRLNFENHIKSLCNKASQKLGSLQRIKSVRYAN